jgi:1,2-diacylglycerol 3-alpha-glucosyltransferase
MTNNYQIQRIGILTNTYPPIRNGVSMAVIALEQELTKRGIEVYIATPKVEGVEYKSNVFTYKAVELPKDISSDLKLAPVYIGKVKKFFREKDIQILHTSDSLFGGVEGAFIANELDIPCVHTFHTLVESYKMVSFPAYNRIIRRGLKEICDSYNQVIAPSTKVYKYLLGLTVAPISQIYNVSYLNNVEYIETDKFDFLQFDDDDFVFLTFCRLSKEKGLDLGIDTLAQILQNDKKVKYVIAGDGPEKEELVQQAIKYGIQDQVFFAGKYSPNELQTLVQKSRAKAFLFTSLSENLPTNILEAMHFGLPVLAVDDESVDYIVKSPLGTLFERCLEVIYTDGLCEKLGVNAKQTAVEFLQKDIASAHIHLYNNVLERYYTEGYNENKKIDIESILTTVVEAVKNLPWFIKTGK